MFAHKLVCNHLFPSMVRKTGRRQLGTKCLKGKLCSLSVARGKSHCKCALPVYLLILRALSYSIAPRSWVRGLCSGHMKKYSRMLTPLSLSYLRSEKQEKREGERRDEMEVQLIHNRVAPNSLTSIKATKQPLLRHIQPLPSSSPNLVCLLRRK